MAEWTTEDVRRGVAVIAWTIEGKKEQIARFDRWIAAHDAEVRVQALSEATERALWETLTVRPGWPVLKAEMIREAKAEARREVRDWLGEMISSIGVDPTPESIYRSLADPENPPFGVGGREADHG